MNTAAKALIEHDPEVPARAPEVAQLPAATNIFQVIERAARDPNVDIDKMKQLMEMRERAEARQAEMAFDNAMADAQEEMQPVRADANNPQTKSRYASYHALDTAIRPIYTKHGFSLSFDTADGAEPGNIRIVCKVANRSGHRERPHLDMPNDGKGAKGGDVMTKTHATGSAVTYGKRYLLGMIFNIAVGGDDDGNAAGGKVDNTAISKEQAQIIRDMIETTGTDTERFCRAFKIEAIPDLPANRFDTAVARLNEKKAAAK